VTRQHFAAIAAGLATVQPARRMHAAHSQWRITCLEMADVLGGFNAGFDRARFLAACGYTDSLGARK
jgi:protoporphyrinogen oxidase